MLWPKYRENILAPVTTPLCPHATVDCTPINKGVAIKPKPAPIINCMATSTHTAPGKRMSRKLEAPKMTKTIPQRAVFLKPILRYNFPDKEEDKGHVKLILARI